MCQKDYESLPCGTIVLIDMYNVFSENIYKKLLNVR